MANPFLMEELEMGTTQVTTSTAGFNPFLSNSDFNQTSIPDNPFMSIYTATDPNSSFQCVGNSNPFSFASEEPSRTTDFFGSTTLPVDQQKSYDNIFQSQHQQQPDFFSSFSVPSTNSNELAHVENYLFTDQTQQQNNGNYFTSEYSDESGLGDEQLGRNSVGPPRRPPPPRPLPPSKETKDLILSVTGTMEATSTHLLDRLQATRTPSPTPMRDLHSPSPTPDTGLPDLLGVDDTTSKISDMSSIQDFNLLGDIEEDAMSAAEPSLTLVPTISASSMTPIAPVSPAPLVIPVTPIPVVASPNMNTPLPPITPVPSVPFVAATITSTALPTVATRPAIVSHITSTSLPSTTSAISPVSVISSRPPRPVIPPSRPAPPAIPQRPNPPTQLDSRNIVDDFILPSQNHATPEELKQTPQDANENIFDIESSLADANRRFLNISEQNENTFDINKEKDSTFNEPKSEQVAAPKNENELFFGSAEQITGPLMVSENVFKSVVDEPVYSTKFDTNIYQTATFVQPSTQLDNNINQNTNFMQPNYSTDDFVHSADESAFQALDFSSASTTTAKPVQQPFNTFDSFPPSTPKQTDDFDAFAAKFESVGFEETRKEVTVASDPFDPFSSSAFGNTEQTGEVGGGEGFGADDNFASFLVPKDPPPAPQRTPARLRKVDSLESDEADNDFNIFIKPRAIEPNAVSFDPGILPSLAPPPKSPVQSNAFQDTSPRFNPFDKSHEVQPAVTDNIFAQAIDAGQGERPFERTDSQETPPTPLFDEDVSQPLEDFPRVNYVGNGWEMQLRQPNKKKITGQRFWKKVFLRLVYQGENPVLQLFNSKDDKDPFQELPLQPCYSVSDIGAQQYDTYGKIFTIKLQFIFYKERPGVRPGQVTKAERITNKLSQFAAYAIQGDYQGCKEFGSDLKKLGLPVEHAPQISQLFKIGSHSYEDMKQFSICVEEALFRLSAHRDRALNYKMEEVQITAVDELYVEQNRNGGVEKQIARVRLFFLGFLSGMPDVELGVNDLVRQGKEVVGRHDIIPVVTEEWIRLEGVEFHSCIQQDEYEKTRTIKFKPPDACYIELMRFRVRPPKNRELPLQLKAIMCVTGNKVELRADILVPGFSSRKLGQIPCEDVMVRFPIPECWIYLFRVEKHFRYGSVKSAHRRSGKIKGIERFLGTMENMEPQLMEVTSGQAKYEHQHRAIVWRMPRLPKEGQGAYTTHGLVCRMGLTSYDQIPDDMHRICQYAYVEFTMPATQASHTTVRSVSIANSDSDTPPEKYVRQLARHEYRVELEHTQGEGPGDYIAATVTKPVPPTPAIAPLHEEPTQQESDSDSSS